LPDYGETGELNLGKKPRTHTAKEQIYCLVGESDSGLGVAPTNGAKAISGGAWPS